MVGPRVRRPRHPQKVAANFTQDWGDAPFGPGHRRSWDGTGRHHTMLVPIGHPDSGLGRVSILGMVTTPARRQSNRLRFRAGVYSVASRPRGTKGCGWVRDAGGAPPSGTIHS